MRPPALPNTGSTKDQTSDVPTQISWIGELGWLATLKIKRGDKVMIPNPNTGRPEIWEPESRH